MQTKSPAQTYWVLPHIFPKTFWRSVCTLSARNMALSSLSQCLQLITTHLVPLGLSRDNCVCVRAQVRSTKRAWVGRRLTSYFSAAPFQCLQRYWRHEHKTNCGGKPLEEMKWKRPELVSYRTAQGSLLSVEKTIKVCLPYWRPLPSMQAISRKGTFHTIAEFSSHWLGCTRMHLSIANRKL